MVTLGAADAAIIALFVACLLGLGFSARLRDSSLIQYLMAGRNLTVPMFVTTLVCTWYGGILGMGESVSYYGFGTLLMLGVPYYVFGTLYALFLVKKVRSAEEISIPERLALTYGRPVGLVGAGLLFLLAVPSAHVLMLGTLVQAITNWPLLPATIFAAIGGSLFLYRGGLLADVRASMLAFVMMYAGFAVIVAICLKDHSSTLHAFQGQPLGTPTGGQSWTMILSFFILGAWTLVDPGFHQRVASAASPETGRTGLLWCVAFWVIFDLLSITAGLCAVALLKQPPTNALLMYPSLANLVLPPGLKAMFLCGILGTVLCAMVGYALISGATFGREIIAQLKPGLTEGQVKLATRAGIAFGVLLAIGIGAVTQSVVQIWYSWGGIVTGALLIPVLTSYLAPRFAAPRTALLAMCFSAASSLALWINGMRNGNPYLVYHWQGQDFSVGTLIPGLIVSLAVFGLGSLSANEGNNHR
ncbi:MAG: hypothetical protein JNK63_01825 [Chthonomonas sp.]|nr:hypothetical protein [Chthonomonas sp.]